MNGGLLMQIKEQYGSLSKTMRSLVWSGIVALFYYVVDLTVVQPLMEEYSEVTQQINQAKAEAKQLGADILHLENQTGVSTALPIEQQIEEHKEILHKLDDEINNTAAQFVSPDEMALFVEQLLAQSGKLKLVSLVKFPVRKIGRKALDVNPIEKVAAVTSAAKKKENEPPKQEEKHYDIYRHGISFTIKGRYVDLLRYLEKLESMSWQVNWDTASLSSDNYPESTLSLDIYTLSLEKDWMRI